MQPNTPPKPQFDTLLQSSCSFDRDYNRSLHIRKVHAFLIGRGLDVIEMQERLIHSGTSNELEYRDQKIMDR